jgi:hypothetical protein
MRAPLARAGVALPGFEGVLEVEEAVELAVLLLDGLGEIDGLGIASECVDVFLRHIRNTQSGCFLQLEDRNAGVD